MLDYHLLSKEDKHNINHWQYEEKYAVYNLPSEFLMKLLHVGFYHEEEQLNYLGFYDQGILIGYTQLVKKENEVFLGIGVHPNYLNQGYGSQILTIMDSIHIHRYPDFPLMLIVRIWNHRAIHTYQKHGYEIISEPFEQNADTFYKMERRGEIEFYLPQENELYYRKKLCEDEHTMDYNGEIILFPQEKWHTWYQKWTDSNHYYRYIYDFITHQFVGEVAYRLDHNKTIISIIIENDKRHQGYGSKALEKLCTEAKSRGIKVLYDDLKINNPTICLFIKNGFEIIDQNDEVIYIKKVLSE